LAVPPRQQQRKLLLQKQTRMTQITMQSHAVAACYPVGKNGGTRKKKTDISARTFPVASSLPRWSRRCSPPATLPFTKTCLFSHDADFFSLL
ncbi:unnamed protein product, partial [Ectocarpus sp. 12 AP-2014]